MAELVDALDLGSSAVRRESSSLSFSHQHKSLPLSFFIKSISTKKSSLGRNCSQPLYYDMDGLLIDSERIIMQACIAAANEVGIEYTQTFNM